MNNPIIDYFFPTEIVDLIVGNCSLEDLLTFILVSKRYSQIFTSPERNSKKYFYPLSFDNHFLKKGVTEYYDRYDNLSYIYRTQAKCRNKYTTKPSIEKMMRFVPFDHPQFKKDLLTKNMRKVYRKDILSFQDLRSIKSLIETTKLDEQEYSCCFYNPNDEVFEWGVEEYYKGVQGRLYCKYFTLTYKRLEHLLSKKIFIPDWTSFLQVSNDLGMYKRVYQAHLDNGIDPILSNYFRTLIYINQDIAEWCVNIWDITNLTGINIGPSWNMETALYLAKRRILKHQFVWQYINRHGENEKYILELFKIICSDDARVLMEKGAQISVLKGYYEPKLKFKTIHSDVRPDDDIPFDKLLKYILIKGSETPGPDYFWFTMLIVAQEGDRRLVVFKKGKRSSFVREMVFKKDVGKCVVLKHESLH